MGSDTVSGKAAVDLAFIAYENGVKTGREEAKPPKIREAVWTVEKGAVRITYPEPMNPDDVDDLEAFIALWIRGCRRMALAAVAKAAEEPAPPAEPDVGDSKLTRDA